MSLLAVSLSTVGISRASGVELVAQREQLDATLPKPGESTQQPAASDSNKPASTSTDTQPAAKTGPAELSPEQRRVIAELQQIDRSVRAHEQAHIQAGQGVVTGGPSYSYTYGPDGRQYAIGGEVGIDTSPEHKPQANIDKGIRIQAAALAPRDPSPQDYRVASVGGQLQAQGQSDLARQQLDERALEAERSAQAREASLRQAYAAPEQATATPASGASLSVFA